MGFSFKVVAFGFGALSLAIGGLLLWSAFNYTPDPMRANQEMSAGWVFVGIGVFAWIVGVLKSLLG